MAIQEDQPTGQGQNEPIVIGSTPAKREELALESFSLDPLLVNLGFTDRLPVLMGDLNYELGGNDLGEVEDTPKRITYKLDPHRLAPRMIREESYHYGPRIELTGSPQEGKSVLKIGNIPIIIPSYVRMSEWLPMRGIDSPHITYARLQDIQRFLRDIFPERKAYLYRPGYRTGIDEEFDLLTLERLEELPTNSKNDPSEPYMVRIEGTDSSHRFDPFLVLGLEDFYGGPTNPKDERIFNIQALVYDTKEYKGSGEDIERIMEGIRLLWAKNPLVEQYNEEYRQRAQQIRERFLGHPEQS